MRAAKRFWGLLLVAVLASGMLGITGCAKKEPPKTLSVVIDCEANRKDEAEAVAANLRAIGVQAETRVWEWSALKAKMLAGERQMYLTDWGSAYFDPFDLAVPKLKTKDRGNYSFYANANYDAQMDAALTSIDQAKREAAYIKAQEILFKDAPWVFGYFREEVEAASAAIGNWRPAMDSRINLHDVTYSAGDTITVGMKTNAIVTLDPAMYRDRDTETVIRNIFDGLVTRTWDGKVVPEIAESWTNPADNIYEFKIRKGITFSNGERLDADDVVFTFQRILDKGGVGGQSSPRVGLMGPVEKVEKVDAYTVRFALKNPFPVFLQALVQFQIVPMSYVKEVGDKKFAEAPVGAGPFRYVEGRLDDQIVLERFDGYYGGSPDQKPAGKAQVKRVIFRMMPDPATRIAALKAGEVQIIQQVPPDMAQSLGSDKKVQVKSVEGTRCYGIELNNASAPFNDVKVRQAMNYAVNWDQILKTIYGGGATRLATTFLPSGFGFDKNLKPYPYDPQKAKALLKEAGYAVSK